jgi:hypothetical protein
MGIAQQVLSLTQTGSDPRDTARTPRIADAPDPMAESAPPVIPVL